MVSIGEAAAVAEKKKTKNISDLGKISIDKEIKEKVFKEGTPDEYTLQVIEHEGEDYRVPLSVLLSIKELKKKYPQMKTFEVLREGTTQNDTRYQVIPVGL